MKLMCFRLLLRTSCPLLPARVDLGVFGAQAHHRNGPKVFINRLVRKNFVPFDELLDSQHIGIHLLDPLRWWTVGDDGLQAGRFGAMRPMFKPPHHRPHRI